MTSGACGGPNALMLPSRDGVSPSCVALPSGSWLSVAEFLAQRLPKVSLSDWQARMACGEVLDEQGLAIPPQAAYRPQSKVYYYRHVPQEARIPFDETVIYQDDYLVVADKPHFLPVTPSGRYVQETLLVRLKRKLGIDTLSPVHRIDRDTAGLVLFTIQPETRGAYQRLFRERCVIKHYEAIAPWRADLSLPMVHRSRLKEMEGPAFMQMQEISGEPNAETRIDLIEQHGLLAHYRLSPVTGQKHQLRAHMTALGIPILNDPIYPTLLPDAPPDHSKPLQLLARSLAFTDPITGQARQFESQRQLRFPSDQSWPQDLIKNRSCTTTDLTGGKS